MRLLTRYVLWEVGVVFTVALAAFTLFFMVVGVVKEAASHGLDAVHIIRMFPYLVPNALLYAIPGTLLLAISNVYGRMSGSNEIVALKSLGISPMVVVWPTYAMAVLLSLATVWINDVAVSWGYQGVQRVVLDSVEGIIYGMLRSQGSYNTKSFSVNVKRVEDRTLVGPVIFTFQGDDDSPPVTIVADEAELRSRPGSEVLTVIFRRGTATFGASTFDFPDVFEREIPLGEASRKGSSTQSPSHLPLRELPKRIEQQLTTINRVEQQLAAQAAYQMMTGDFDNLAGGNWTADLKKLQDQKSQLHKLRTEPPRRWANGFSCLCFALIGVPVAIRLRNSDFLMSFFLCFLPILIVYYPLLATGVDRAKAGTLSPMAVWMANVVLALAGWRLMRGVIRY